MNSAQIIEGAIQTLDLNFLGFAGAIAVYLIPHAHGVVLIECGPGSTNEALVSGLQAYGLKVGDISDVLLTHIHLDHAGAAGWLARQGARIHVHPVGAPHLLNPEKLLSSARRIYGDSMQTLWGDVFPVPDERLQIHLDDEIIEIEGLRFRALDTPGHAYHHFAYLYEDVCFSGDIGGVRVGGVRHVRLPMPPPEFNLELWRESIHKLQAEYARGGFRRIAPTHFGTFDDPGWHLKAVDQALDDVEGWILHVMPTNPSPDELKDLFIQWTEERSLRYGLEPGLLGPFEAVNPSWMSAYGIHRYWHKVHNASQDSK
jgi:glyoxylase-like metal-dependent hydrolase (beta-lactamase superfamily II)